MTEIIKVKTPDNWGDITLKKYLELQKDLEAYKDDEDAQLDIMLYHLCGLNVEQTKQLTAESYKLLKNDIVNLLANQESPLITTFVSDGILYGFEPNLSKMSYGAYVDITKYDTIQIDDNWAKIMGILYRPVINKSKDKYEIAPYTGFIDSEMWYDVGMDVHFGALFFFVHLSTDLLNSTLNSMMQMPELPPNIKSILEGNGSLIQRLLS